MKKILSLILVLIALSGFSQEGDTKIVNYTEFLNLIKNDRDSLVELSNIYVKFDSLVDSRYGNTNYDGSLPQYSSKPKDIKLQDTIKITRPLQLTNIVFDRKLYLKDCKFKSTVSLINSNLSLFNNTFEDGLSVVFTNENNNVLREYRDDSQYIGTIINNDIRRRFRVNSRAANLENSVFFLVFNNRFYSEQITNPFLFRFDQSTFTLVIANRFFGKGKLDYYSDYTKFAAIRNNNFGDYSTEFQIAQTEPYIDLEFHQNTFNVPVSLDIKHLQQEDFIGWQQFKNGIYNEANYSFYLEERFEPNPLNTPDESESNFEEYFNNHIYKNKLGYDRRMKFLGKYYNYFRSQYAIDKANSIYQNIKDLETKRLNYQYEKNPTFTTFFKWRINQFLKVFSGYGTQPQRAVIVSLYVILLFALIYLFFPNSWDKHGKNRIIDRYSFFFKYMNNKAGMHDVYLEDQQDELMSYDQFKANITNSKQKVPKFFTATALPLYRWAISGTKLSAWFLKRIDIMKGTWSELPKSKRIWKSILLVGAFLIAIVYDIFIKMLNALMLSINTFTTLGFGEIPIKGLPRYLAIIQGFIGWFMLTIFSVSLISQLLN